MISKIFLLFVFAFFVSSVVAQNCGQISVGNPAYVPINDLRTGTWNGFMGGLYQNGSNYIPANHKKAGLQMANQIQPLDKDGFPDPR